MTLYFFIIIILGISGLSVLWRKILIDFPKLDAFLQSWLGPIGYALICGFCYTYWLSLFAVLLFGPAELLASNIFFSSPGVFKELILIGISWMAIAFCAQTLRFIFVILQQLLVYFLHILNVDLEHKH